MKKDVLWVSIGFSFVGIINLILFAVLSSVGIVDVRKMTYLFAVTQLILAWFPALLNKVLKMTFNLTFLISFQLYIFLGICVGSQWGVYQLTSSFDKIVHTIGGFMLAFLGYTLFCNEKNKNSIYFGCL